MHARTHTYYALTQNVVNIKIYPWHKIKWRYMNIEQQWHMNSENKTKKAKDRLMLMYKTYEEEKGKEK